MTSSNADAATNGQSGLIKQVFEDIDEQAQCLTGYDQKYQQLSRGQFEGRFSTALLSPDLGLYFEQLNQVLDQSGSVPQDQYSIILLMNEDQPCKLNGRDFSSDDLFLGSPGASFHTLSRVGTHFCVVSIEKNTFETLHHVTMRHEKTGFGSRDEGLREDLHRASHSNAGQLRQIVRDAVTVFETTPEVLSKAGSLSGLRRSLGEMISSQIAAELPGNSNRRADTAAHTRHPSGVNHARTVHRAREYIHANADTDVSITTLCHHVGVSRRALEYSFQVCLEQSPAIYLRLVRLNEIRRALHLRENSQRSIGDIAAQWGVWHLGRFAQYYQHQFGELPSQTRYRLDTQQ